MTSQQIFNRVARHLLKQNSKAKRGKLYVCYDKKTEKRCAVGCLLPLKFYRKQKKETYLDEITKRLYIDYGDDRKDLLYLLQKCHDNYHPNQWSKRLRVIANLYRLNVPECLR